MAKRQKTEHLTGYVFNVKVTYFLEKDRLVCYFAEDNDHILNPKLPIYTRSVQYHDFDKITYIGLEKLFCSRYDYHIKIRCAARGKEVTYVFYSSKEIYHRMVHLVHNFRKNNRYNK